jgi:hypothetical protein
VASRREGLGLCVEFSQYLSGRLAICVGTNEPVHRWVHERVQRLRCHRHLMQPRREDCTERASAQLRRQVIRVDLEGR